MALQRSILFLNVGFWLQSFWCNSILRLHISVRGMANGAGAACHQFIPLPPHLLWISTPPELSELNYRWQGRTVLLSQLVTMGPSGKSAADCLETGKIGPLINQRKDGVVGDKWQVERENKKQTLERQPVEGVSAPNFPRKTGFFKKHLLGWACFSDFLCSAIKVIMFPFIVQEGHT